MYELPDDILAILGETPAAVIDEPFKEKVIEEPIIKDSKPLKQPEIDPRDDGKVSKLYTYFGCKTKVIDTVWEHFGNDKGWSKLFEPFAGTAIVSLNAPDTVKELYINDFDCHVANVLRSVIYYPDIVIEHACHPRLELDLHMIHDYLQTSKPILKELLMSGIEKCDPIKAGWWIWGCNNWLGGGWGTEHGCLKTLDDLALKNRDLWKWEEEPTVTWRLKPNNRDRVTENKIEPRATRIQKLSHRDCVTENKIEPRGTLRRKLIAYDQVTENKIEPTATGRNKLNHGNQITESGYPRKDHITNLIYRAYTKLRDAKILYGDFGRLITDSYANGKCLIFLDPPYPNSNDQTYVAHDTEDVFTRALNYFLEHYSDKDKRIIFCCQESDIKDKINLNDCRVINWSRGSGYSSGCVDIDEESVKRRTTEIMLLSEACL